MIRAVVIAALLIAAYFAAVIRLAVIIGRRLRRSAAARETAALPGPGQPQASGVGDGDDTGVKSWTDDEIAYLRGELKELPK